MDEIKKELKQIKIQVILGIEQKEIKQQYGILLLDSIEKAELLTLTDVVKPFYCEKQTNLLKQCVTECDYCKRLSLY